MMRQVAFIADDFGRDAPTNDAVIRSHLNGALDGASLMLGQPGTEEAIELARLHPTLRVGWHIHLCDSRPVSLAQWPWGSSPLKAGLLLVFYYRGIRSEMSAQWARFRASEIPASFMNSHHHLHAHPVVMSVLRDLLPRPFGGWLRGFNIRAFSRHLPLHARVLRVAGTRTLARSNPLFQCSDSTWGLDRLFAMDAQEIANVLPRLGPGLHEFVFHPRRTSADADFTALQELRSRAMPCGERAPHLYK